MNLPPGCTDKMIEEYMWEGVEVLCDGCGEYYHATKEKLFNYCPECEEIND